MKHLCRIVYVFLRSLTIITSHGTSPICFSSSHAGWYFDATIIVQWSIWCFSIYVVDSFMFHAICSRNPHFNSAIFVLLILRSSHRCVSCALYLYLFNFSLSTCVVLIVEDTLRISFHGFLVINVTYSYRKWIQYFASILDLLVFICRYPHIWIWIYPINYVSNDSWCVQHQLLY